MIRIFCISIVLVFISFNVKAICNLTTGCASAPVFSVSPPVFNAANLSIDFNTITFGNIDCNDSNYKSGIVFYIYQLMPNGTRTYQCTVEAAAPFNVVGNISAEFGQSSFCGNTIQIGPISANPSSGFEACDGARYEIEGALYISEDLSFDALNSSIYNQLPATQYTVLNLGTVDVNINNEFPGNGQPLTTAIINDYNTGSDGPIQLTCGQDIELYVEGLSRLSNCIPYSDVYTGIPSELTNEFYYTIDGGAPIIIKNSSTGAAGGQLTGPDASLGGLCYAGILNNNAPYILPYADLSTEICDGTELVFTIKTTDLFTNQTVQDQITVIYNGSTCGNNCCANVDLSLSFDNIPAQTSWVIYNASNTAVASGNGYGSQPAYSNVVESTCLSDGCYTLVVQDAIGNGMCPFQSSAIGVSTFITPGTLITPGAIVGTLSLVATPGLCGSYNIKDTNGTTLASGGGAFGASQSNSFCLTNGTAPRLLNSSTANNKFSNVEIWPNPVKDLMYVSLNTGAINDSFEIKIVDISGKTQDYVGTFTNENQLKISTASLKSGFYFVQIVTSDYVVSEKFLK